MALDGIGNRPSATPLPQGLAPSGVAPTGDVRQQPVTADVAAPAATRVPVLPAASRPALPEVREDLLEGLSPQEAFAALSARFEANRSRSAESQIDNAARLRTANAPARTEVVEKAADNFLVKLWNAVAKTVTSNPAAAIGLVVTTVTSIAGVVASGGVGIPAAIAAISAAAAPFVTAVAANAGVDLNQMLTQGVEEVLKLAGVDAKNAWKASNIIGSVINLGVSVGAAVVAGNPAVFDVSRVAQVATSIANAFEMKGTAVATISETVRGFAALGMLIGGSIASGASVLNYGGLDKILSGGDSAFKAIVSSFSQGIDLKQLGEGGAKLLELVPMLQQLFGQAFTDLQANGKLISLLQESYQAIVDHVESNAALAQDTLNLRHGLR